MLKSLKPHLAYFNNYPKLSTLARRVLCSPATSVPSERVFSIAGSTVSKLRASLDSDTVDMLVFLNKRFKSVPPSVEANGSVTVKVEPQSSLVEQNLSIVKAEPNLSTNPKLKKGTGKRIKVKSVAPDKSWNAQ